MDCVADYGRSRRVPLREFQPEPRNRILLYVDSLARNCGNDSGGYQMIHARTRGVLKTVVFRCSCGEYHERDPKGNEEKGQQYYRYCYDTNQYRNMEARRTRII